MVIGREQLLVGLLQFAVGIFEFQVGHLQTTGTTDAEEEEDGQREHDDRSNDDGVKGTGPLLLQAHISEVELRVHLCQLALGIVGVDGVVDGVDVIIELGCLAVVTHLLQNLGALLADTYLCGGILRLAEIFHALVVEGEGFIIKTLCQAEVGTRQKPEPVQVAALVGTALLYLVEHL